MRVRSFVLFAGLLSGCIHNWSAYEPPTDSGSNQDIVLVDVQPVDVPHPDVPDVIDTVMPVDVVDTTPPADVVDVPPPMDVVDVPIVPDVPVVDVPADAPCGANGAACCAPALCAPTLVCRVDMICATTCATGTTACGSVCFNTQTDPSNCGSCGTVCHGGRACVGGSCM